MAKFSVGGLDAIQHFAKDESGAVTVDWVALTAAILSLVLLLFTVLTESVYEDAATDIANNLGTARSLVSW